MNSFTTLLKSSRSYLSNSCKIETFHRDIRPDWRCFSLESKRDELVTDIKAKYESKATAKGVVRLSGVKKGTKRWYKNVTVEPFEVAGEKGYVVKMDGRSINTTRDSRLVIPSLDLANAVAMEWDAQQTVDPAQMPLMTFAGTAIDSIPENRNVFITHTLRKLQNDLLLSRDPMNRIFMREAKQKHDPLVRWFAEYTQLPQMHVNYILRKEQIQPAKTIDAVQYQLYHLGDWHLAALGTLVNALKSFILGLAVWQRRITPDEGVRLMQLETDINTSINGLAVGYHDVEEAQIATDVHSAAFHLWCLPPSEVNFKNLAEVGARITSQDKEPVKDSLSLY